MITICKHLISKKTLTIFISSIIVFIISLTSISYAIITNNQKHNANMMLTKTSDSIPSNSWIGYDYNNNTWLDMTYKSNDVAKLMSQMSNQMIDYHTDSQIMTKDTRNIIGDDGRESVNTNVDKTTAGIAYIHSVIYDTRMNTCSGTLIAKNYILTAAHCTTQYGDSINKPCPNNVDCNANDYGDTSKFNESINVYINRNKGDDKAGYYRAKRVFVPQAWRIDGIAHSTDDISLIEINPDANGKYPTDYDALIYGYGSFHGDFINAKSSIIGYPSDKWNGDKGMDSMYLSDDHIDNTDESFNSNNRGVKNNEKINPIDNFTFKMDTFKGSSGAGLRYWQNGRLYIIGVNTEERELSDNSKEPNIGVRITHVKYAWLQTIMQSESE